MSSAPSMMDFDWLDLVNVLYRQQQPLSSCLQWPCLVQKMVFLSSALKPLMPTVFILPPPPLSLILGEGDCDTDVTFMDKQFTITYLMHIDQDLIIFINFCLLS